MQKYLVNLLQDKKWELSHESNDQVISDVFDDFKSVINHLKKLDGEFEVIDLNVNGIARFKDGQVVHIESEYGLNDRYMARNYLGVEIQDDDY